MNIFANVYNSFKRNLENHMNLKKIIFFLSFLSICVFTYAIPHSTITLKNGSVINGDIVVQRVGKDMTIEAENATLLIDPKDIMSRKTRKVKYENLSREMKRWVLENRTLKGDAYGRYAELEDIKTKKYAYSDLIIKPQEESNNISFVQVSPSTFTVKWSDIQNISKNVSEDIKDQLIDIVTTYNGKTYEGKILSQKNGESITLNTSKGQVTISNKEVKEIRKKKPEGSNSYFNNIDYLNIILLKDGKEKEGLITAHHYGKKAKGNEIILLKRDGKTEIIPVSAISEYRTKYDTKERPIYIPGKVYINEFKIDKARFQRLSDNIVFLEKQVFPFPEGISITFKSGGEKLAGNWSLVALSELSASNGKSSFGYNVNKRKDNTIPPKSDDPQSIIRQISYGYLSPGYYALVNDSESEAYVFKITK